MQTSNKEISDVVFVAPKAISFYSQKAILYMTEEKYEKCAFIALLQYVTFSFTFISNLSFQSFIRDLLEITFRRKKACN